MTQSTAGPGPGQPSQRVFTGTVTKLHDNFGFVDDDVFFQTSTVKGDMPRIHDRVLVEAGYNPNMPFKWNASRVQVQENEKLWGLGLKDLWLLGSWIFEVQTSASEKPCIDAGTHLVKCYTVDSRAAVAFLTCHRSAPSVRSYAKERLCNFKSGGQGSPTLTNLH